jgi:energy-coupling factor transport system ATP-binding protein
MSIIFEDVSYKYPATEVRPGDPRGGWALRHINLTIEPGELVGVVGRNGAGKSTLCVTISGLIPHFFHGDLRGRVLVDGVNTQDAAGTDLITKVGVLFQNPFEQLTGVTETVYQEVAFGPENLGRPIDEIRQRVDEALAAAGVTALAERHPFALSGGQQQRVALASVLAMRPQIMVLDEPTSQLDPIGTDEVFEIVHRMHGQGYTILLAEHKVEALAELATRILVLFEGKVVLDGPPAEVFRAANLSEYRVLPPRYALLGRALAERALRPAGSEPLTLDDAAVMLRQVTGRAAA